MEAQRTFQREVATVKCDSWCQLCTESTWAELWFLYHWLSQPRAHGDVDSLLINGEVGFRNEGKATALAPIFFPSLPTSSDRHQRAIDFVWGTHQPPGNRDFVEVSLTKAWDAVKAMPWLLSQA